MGLITEDQPQEVTYPDGSKAVAYVGIHLKNGEGLYQPIGRPWSSRNPTVVGDVNDFQLPASGAGTPANASDLPLPSSEVR